MMVDCTQLCTLHFRLYVFLLWRFPRCARDVHGARYIQSSSLILVLCMVLDLYNSYLCYCTISGYIIDKNRVFCIDHVFFFFKGKGEDKITCKVHYL
jgi:hypothetical protein